MSKNNFKLWRGGWGEGGGVKDSPKLDKKQKSIINPFNKYDDKYLLNTATLALNHKEIVKS